MTNSHIKADDLDASSALDGDSHASVSHRYRVVLQQLDDGPKFTHEWFRLKEEEIELRRCLNRDASSCSAIVTDSIRLVDEQSDSSATDIGGANASTGTISRVIPDSSTDTKIPEALTKEERLTPLPTDVSSMRVFNGKPKHIQKNETETFMETLDSADSNSPPIPLSGHNCKFEERSIAKKIAAETFVDVECAPVPCVLSADVSLTENLSSTKATKLAKGENSASRQLERAALSGQTTPPNAVPDYMNQDQAPPNQEIVQQSSAMHTIANINYGLLSSFHVTQETSNLPRSVTDALSQSWPNESVPRDEEKEDIILIPEAFMVEENGPQEMQIAEVAELVEPDPSRLSLKKRHACLFLVCVAAVLALGIGLSIKLTRTNQPNSRSFPPSSQPTVLRRPPQPSLSMRHEMEANVLQRNATFDGNRGLALDWIMNTDDFQVEASDANLYQRYILALLSFEFGISGWWLSGSSECEWQGVGCGSNATVVKLELDYLSLSGTIPPEIAGLLYLKRLSLKSNSLNGTIPSELGKLSSLTSLSLGWNDLNGTLPSELGNLKELTSLSLEFNELTGTIPSELRNMNAVTTFSIAQNHFRGTFPSWLVESFVLIDHLHIDSNQFTGALPSEIGMLTTLEHLDFHSNGFSGTLPPEIGKLTMLTYLDFGDNLLRGILPPEIGTLTSLTNLRAPNNQLTGMIPSEIGNLIQLTDLWLYGNHLSGPLPSEIGYLASLAFLSVGPNNLNGTVPAEMGNLSEVWHLSLGVNNFTGIIPSEIGQLSNLTELLLQENRFTGHLPPGLKNCSTGMTRFCFNDNQLTGVLPTECGCDV
eukprot:CCRYP_008660-RA/>CCRYP_008660-RA protein AED:0.08 eAED:0.13 QI:0/1/0.5/1/1/1/2/169/821